MLWTAGSAAGRETRVVTFATPPLLRNVRPWGDAPVDLTLEDGRITEVVHGAATERPSGVEIVDANGLCLAPGLIDTPIYGSGPDSDAFKANLGKNVLFPKRLGVPDELASMVEELITNSYMNAEVVRVDGGIRMPPK